MSEIYPFIIKPNPEETGDYVEYYNRILRLTGGRSSRITEQDIEELSDGVPSDKVARDYIFKQPNKRLQTIFVQEIRQAIEGYWNLPNFRMSYGVFSPSYLQALIEYHQLNSSNKHIAVLIGAQSQDTVREYTATVKSIFPNSERIIVDIAEGTPEMTDEEMTTFILRDARSPVEMESLGKESVDTIHTNILLKHLKPLQGYTDTETRIQMFSNMLTILKQGGMCMMVEKLEYEQNGDMRRQIVAEMNIAGFRNIQIRPAEAFLTRRDVGRFMKGNVPVVANGTTQLCRNIDLITGYKQ